MEPAFFVTVSRSVERLAIVVAGTASIWFGYRLFFSVETNDSTASFKFGDNAISLTKIGPGVLFAAFGIFLLWKCLAAVVTIGAPTPSSGKRGSSTQSLVFGLPQAGISADITRLRTDLAVINALADGTGSTDLDPADVERVLHQARVALLLRHWDPAWGGADVKQRVMDGQLPEQGPLADLYRTRLHSAFR